MPRISKQEGATNLTALRLSDLAYKRLLDALFQRKISVGAFLSQNYLSQLLEVPIQPLRDALKVLEADGLVTIHPRSGIQFIHPDMAFHHHTYQFRTLIERSAARRYADVGDANEIDALINDHNALVARIQQQPIDDLIIDKVEELELRLHDGMVGSLNNPLIEAAAARLKNYVLLIRLDRVLTTPFLLQTLNEHLEILKACANRDPGGAEKAVVAHFQASMGRLLGNL